MDRRHRHSPLWIPEETEGSGSGDQIIDRQSEQSRISDSVEQALSIGIGELQIAIAETRDRKMNGRKSLTASTSFVNNAAEASRN